MAVYEYVCTECGRFDIRRDIGTAPDRHGCPRCGRDARRAYSAPMLRLVAGPASQLMDSAARSADAPEVVTQVPPRLRRPAPTTETNPALARLPRP